MKLSSLGVTKVSILLLAIVTGVIHLFLGDTIFILNGLGYLCLVGLYIFAVNVMSPQMFAPIKPALGWLLIAYTLLTFILYFVVNWPDVWFPLGLITKFVELLLIVQLLRDR